MQFSRAHSMRGSADALNTALQELNIQLDIMLDFGALVTQMAKKHRAQTLQLMNTLA